VRRVSGLRALASGPTFPADAPARQLDHVLARGPVRPSGAVEVPLLPLSDHRALVVPCDLG
jgi:endonuclease/exonuclease/phosphatase (EEP) superfamily protein YafD